MDQGGDEMVTNTSQPSIRGRHSSALGPIETATDAAILALLAKASRAGSTYQLGGLVRDLRGSATRAEVRESVNRLSRKGLAACYSANGQVLVRGLR